MIFLDPAAFHGLMPGVGGKHSDPRPKPGLPAAQAGHAHMQDPRRHSPLPRRDFGRHGRRPGEDPFRKTVFAQPFGQQNNCVHERFRRDAIACGQQDWWRVAPLEKRGSPWHHTVEQIMEGVPRVRGPALAGPSLPEQNPFKLLGATNWLAPAALPEDVTTRGCQCLVVFPKRGDVGVALAPLRAQHRPDVCIKLLFSFGKQAPPPSEKAVSQGRRLARLQPTGFPPNAGRSRLSFQFFPTRGNRGIHRLPA